MKKNNKKFNVKLMSLAMSFPERAENRHLLFNEAAQCFMPAT